MRASRPLLTVAQIAVAFAGFGALASNYKSSASTQMRASQLTSMTESSLFVMALAPFGLALFEMPEQWLWPPMLIVEAMLFSRLILSFLAPTKPD